MTIWPFVVLWANGTACGMGRSESEFEHGNHVYHTTTR
jgi:hypothetical protein